MLKANSVLRAKTKRMQITSYGYLNYRNSNNLTFVLSKQGNNRKNESILEKNKNVRKRLRKALRKPNSFNRSSKTNPQTVTWLEKLTAYTRSSKKRLLQKKFCRTRHNRTLHFAYAMTNLKIYLSSCARALSRATRGQLLSS